MQQSADYTETYKDLVSWMRHARSNTKGYVINEFHDLMDSNSFREEPEFSAQCYEAEMSFYAEVSGTEDSWQYGDSSIATPNHVIDVDTESLAIMHWMFQILQHPELAISYLACVGHRNVNFGYLLENNWLWPKDSTG